MSEQAPPYPDDPPPDPRGQDLAEAHPLEELLAAAAALHERVHRHLGVLNLHHWIGPELARLERARRRAERWRAVQRARGDGEGDRPAS